MAKGVIDVFDNHIDPTEFLKRFGKGIDCIWIHGKDHLHHERQEARILRLHSPDTRGRGSDDYHRYYPDYESLPNFDCMTAWEKQQVIEKFRKKYNIADDVDMDDDADAGDEANDELGQGYQPRLTNQKLRSLLTLTQKSPVLPKDLEAISPRCSCGFLHRVRRCQRLHLLWEY